MYKILLEDLENAKNKTLHVEFDDVIKEIPSKGNIKAELEVHSLGDIVEVTGNIEGILLLECDRCLSEFEWKLDAQIDETYAKGTMLEEYGRETEIKDGQFMVDLEGKNEIDIYDLLYQSVILNLPNNKVCGINCNEDLFEKEENFQITDSRLEVFKNIKITK